MIEREEIDKLASELEVNPPDVERDYVNGWLLTAIYGHTQLGQHLILKGGNALRKGYFRNTRYSQDLDFSTPSGLDKIFLASELATACAWVQEQSGVQFQSEELQVTDKDRVTEKLEVLEVRAYFFDFYGKKQKQTLRVYMDVTQYDKLIRTPSECKLIHPYSDAEQCQGVIKCVAIEEILASKLKCLLQRRRISDLYDYLHWMFFEGVEVDRADLLKIFLQKTIYERSPGAAFELLRKLPFMALQELWDRHIVCPIDASFSFDAGVKKFQAHLMEMFGNLAQRFGPSLQFFSTDMRSTIMQAGQRKHILSLEYDGIERQIEPYSLKFGVRKDGGGGEYLYVWDRTGGRNSGPGIKRFVPQKIHNLQELDEEFKPQYEIEVAKAGDLPENPRFSAQSKQRKFVPGFGVTRQSRRRGSGPTKYVFRCLACKKLFRRATHKPKLGVHKGSNGLRCPGSNSYGSYDGYR